MDPPLRPQSHVSPYITTSTQDFSTRKKLDSQIHTPHNTFSSGVRKGLEGRVKDEYSTSGKMAGIGWDESNDIVSERTTRLQIELAECVETKTITTTTTTKRSYPPLLVHPPRCLQSLDIKEYPLALKPTPFELANFSYEINGEMVHFREDPLQDEVDHRQVLSSTAKSTVQPQPQALSSDRRYETPVAAKPVTKKRLRHGVYPRSFTDRLRSPDSLGKASGRAQRGLGYYSRRRDPGTTSSQSKVEISEDASIAAQPPAADVPELDGLANNNRTSLSFMTSASDEDMSTSFEEMASPSVAAAQILFPSAVATPPIAESDLEPYDELSRALGQPTVSHHPLNAISMQGASLPSPSLSPTFANTNLHSVQLSSTDNEDIDVSFNSFSASAESQESLNRSTVSPKPRLVRAHPQQRTERASQDQKQKPTVMDTSAMLDTFDMMPNEMKNFMMYQFLRRCPRQTLHVVADVVNPALKCDFLGELPLELSLQILGFLDHRDLCRAAQVSKRWRTIIDTNETGWKELMERDGFTIPSEELDRAIKEGWGWQDPYGPDACERDLSRGIISSDAEPNITSRSARMLVEPVLTRARSTKRKRAPGGISLDRSKRRALSQEPSERLRASESRNFNRSISKGHKSEGANAAATAAALAVPNPNIGLPNLQKLHLFKSLYRRRYMLQRNWMSSEVDPQHMAFPAHPRHVITCLQFDDDKILTGSDDTYIHVYDTKTGVLRKRLEGHEGGVWALQYEGNILVSGSTDRSVRVWDIEKGLCTQVFHGHTSTVRCLQILLPAETGKYSTGKPVMVPSKPLIITGSRDSQLRVWRLPEQGAKRYIQTGPPANDADCPYFIRVLSGHNQSVRAIAAHGDTLVSGSYDNSVRVWKISTGETTYQLRGHTQKVYSVVLDHKRKRCISGSMDNSVKIWSLESGICLNTLEGHTSLVGLLDLQHDRLVSAAADSTLRIWDPENGQCKNTLTAHTGAITCFQHDGAKVISGSDRTLKMWNVKTGECLKDLLTDLSGVWQVKFDERRCVAAVQRENLTFIEILDFGASRDGVPRHKRGQRILMPPSDADRITEDDEFVQ